MASSIKRAASNLWNKTVGSATKSTANSTMKGYPNDRHVNTKDYQLDPQSEGAVKAKQAKSKAPNDSAASQSDIQNSTQQARKDHPKAPSGIIGMQDERGARGA